MRKRKRKRECERRYVVIRLRFAIRSSQRYSNDKLEIYNYYIIYIYIYSKYLIKTNY